MSELVDAIFDDLREEPVPPAVLAAQPADLLPTSPQVCSVDFATALLHWCDVIPNSSPDYV